MGEQAEGQKIIRYMQESDLDAVIAIEQESFATPWSLQAFRVELRDNDYARYFCLEVNEQVVGYMGLWFIFDEGHITNIAIAPQLRGQGWGEFLLRSVMSEMRLDGMERMTLEVRLTNTRAIGLYERLGFVAAGVRKGYYADTQEDALIMWAELRDILAEEKNQE